MVIKYKEGDVIQTNNGQVCKLLEYRGEGLWYVRLIEPPYYDGVIYESNIEEIIKNDR